MRSHLRRAGPTLAGLCYRPHLSLRASVCIEGQISRHRHLSHCSVWSKPAQSVPHNRNARSTRHFASATDTSLKSHAETVKSISGQVKEFQKLKQKFRINHGSTNSTRVASKGAHILDLSSLNKVLKVDPVRKVALVEPNVPMDRLVEATLPYGLVPPVVMEFPGITVGGGFAGTAGESSSFKHGFFNHTIESVELVLATGEVVKCSRNLQPDLFWGAAGAVGSLGVTTLVELRLHEAKRFVETTYHPVNNMHEAVEKIDSATKDETLDYVDGIMFSKTQGAVVTGRMVDTPAESLPVQRFSSASDPWFYQHVQSKITSGKHTEAIPLPEYLFRYDRAGFWVGGTLSQYISF